MPHCITKEFSVDFGHRVHTQELDSKLAENQPCKCRHLHGHTGKLIVELKADVLERGMVTDYAHLNWFKTWLDDHFDHKSIFDIDDPLLRFLFVGYYPVPTLESHNYWHVVRYPYMDASFCIPNSIAVAREGAKWNLSFQDAKALTEAITGMVVVNFIPTAENLSKFFYDILHHKLYELAPRVKVERVTFCETPKTSSVYYAGD